MKVFVKFEEIARAIVGCGGQEGGQPVVRRLVNAARQL